MNPMLSTNSQLTYWQKPIFKAALAVVTLVIVLTMVNFNIYKYEQHLADGNTVLLALAPVDPRSLMQGDYMRLRFAIADDILQAIEQQHKEPIQTKDGWVVVRKDGHNVGQFVRLIDNPNTNLAPDEMAIYYRLRGGQVKFATGAFFFQEGHADKYTDAEYGVLKVNDKGEPLLAGLEDKDFVVIGE
ncbi:GDYXXLXY domain-containing protein [Psychrobacter sp. I-STPA10]|uniref:GDYXXLXY domain-containing protein n=1 Tax=Psychrobacter sp. I-STPA10 TaxID=2585769 RepID=UPI001E562274|nr:GDYXXLXY domain-containing protein [Psychrobacter sp. I-STPA10]